MTSRKARYNVTTNVASTIDCQVEADSLRYRKGEEERIING